LKDNRGWHNDPYRHSLAARGVTTGNFQRIRGDPRTKIVADLLILRDKSPFGDDRYHNRRIFEALEKLRDGIGLTWDEYSSLRLFVEDLHNNGHLGYDDILMIEETFHDLIGAPLHGWNLSDIERGKYSHSEFFIEDEKGDRIAEMSMHFLDPYTGEVPDWDDDDVYNNRKEFLEEMEQAELDFEWISDDMNVSTNEFMRRALPVIMKFAADEGVGLQYSEWSETGHDPELDAVMGGFDFDILYKKVHDHNGRKNYITRYNWDYRAFNPKYTTWVVE